MALGFLRYVLRRKRTCLITVIKMSFLEKAKKKAEEEAKKAAEAAKKAGEKGAQGAKTAAKKSKKPVKRSRGNQESRRKSKRN